jgi:hypothetical protein
MGAWGYASDDNDGSSDAFHELMKKFLPKKITNLQKTDFDMYINARNEYIKNNHLKLYKATKNAIAKEHDPLYIVGLIMIVARHTRPNKNYKVALTKKNISEDFSKELMTIASKNIQKMLISDSSHDWKSISKRNVVLKKELKIFSKKN